MSLARAQDKSGFELVRQFRNCLLVGGYGPEGTSMVLHAGLGYKFTKILVLLHIGFKQLTGSKWGGHEYC